MVSSTEARRARTAGRLLRRLLLGFVTTTSALVVPSARLAAQPVSPQPTVLVGSDRQSDEADDMRWSMSRCLLGLSYGAPLKLSIAAAAGLRRAFEDRSVCTYGAVHLGLGGTKASLGTAVTLGRFGSAVGVSGGVLRTFGAPGGEAKRVRTYVGGSVHVWPVLGFHTDIGSYRLLTRNGEAAQRITTWSIGFGY